MNSIFDRVSVRAYQDRAVEDEKITLLLRAAMQAPSAQNGQPWEIIVVTDKALLKELSLASPHSKMLATAPLCFVMLANTNSKRPQFWQQDLGAATQNVLLEACELELGGVWVGIATVEERMEKVRSIFNLPAEIVPFALVPIGYPATPPKTSVRFDQAKVHYNGY